MTSETDEHFVEQMEKDWNEDLTLYDMPRLFALARRGAAAIADDQCKKEPELHHQDRRFNNAERLFGDD